MAASSATKEIPTIPYSTGFGGTTTTTTSGGPPTTAAFAVAIGAA